MTKTVLKDSLRENILTDVELQAKIAKATNKSVQSVKRWAEQSHEMLLLSPVHDVLRSYLNLNNDETLTEVVEVTSLETISE